MRVGYPALAPRGDKRMSNLIHRSFTAFAALFLASSILIFAAHGAFAHEFKLGALEIIHPWSRATPGGAKVAAGYVVIKNGGAEPDRLVSATAEVAGSVAIHEMATTNGVATMRPVTDGVVIPAHGEIALKPGSYHLMLEDLKQPLKEGGSFKGTLTFEKAGTSDVTFFVESIGAKAPAGEGHEDHMDHMKGM
jgi:copper(I)-binding protein